MDRSFLSYLAGAVLGVIITIVLSLGVEGWSEDPTLLVLGLTSAASKIWLIFYYVQILPLLVISGIAPLQKKFKIKRLVPLSFGLGQATVLIIVVFLSNIVELFN